MVFTADTDRDEKQAACEIFRAAAPVAANVRTTLEHLRPIIPPDLFERFVIGLAENLLDLQTHKDEISVHLSFKPFFVLLIVWMHVVPPFVLDRPALAASYPSLIIIFSCAKRNKSRHCDGILYGSTGHSPCSLFQLFKAFRTQRMLQTARILFRLNGINAAGDEIIAKEAVTLVNSRSNVSAFLAKL